MNTLENMLFSAKESLNQEKFKIVNNLVDTMISYNFDIEVLNSTVYYISLYENKKLNITPSNNVKNIVKKLIELEGINFNLKNKNLHTNNQKLFLLKAGDIKVVITKLIFQIYLMRTLSSKDKSFQTKHSLESEHVFAPIASNIGIYAIKIELEDLSLKYLNKKGYDFVINSIESHESERKEYLDTMLTEINYLIDKKDIDYKIQGRVKHVKSIYNKSLLTNHTLEGLHDLIAIRILVNSIEDCYTALGLVNTYFEPDQSKFKDYITHPKANGYQSLHTVVKCSNGEIYEIQIRTNEMHDFAEKGVAAHWAYKKGNSASKRELATSSDFFEELRELLVDKSKSLKDTSILSKYIYVYTPDMDVYELEKGATPIDFAFRIHSKVGVSLAGAVVNDSMVSLSYELKNEDIISINTSNSSEPKESWLNIAKTKNARNKIKRFLNEKNKESLMIAGKKLLDEELNNYEDTAPISDKLVSKSLSKKNINSVSTLYYELGKKTISPVVALHNIFPKQEKIDVTRLLSLKNTHASDSNKGIVVDGLGKTRIHISKCCNPVPGDEIIGYITLGRGIAVHATDCPNNKTLNDNRLIEVYWGNDLTEVFETGVKIIADNHEKALQSIIMLISNNNIILSNISTKQAEFNKTLVIQMYIKVKNLNSLNDIMNKLNSIEYVIDVKRTKR